MNAIKFPPAEKMVLKHSMHFLSKPARIIGVFLFMFLGQLSAQNIVLKDGLYYASNGTLYSGIYNSYTQTGFKVASITLVDGKKNGPATYYYENGNVQEMGMFLNNEKNEQWLHWDEAGNKIAEAFYQNGKKNGSWMIWDARGTKRYEMFYTLDKKVGKWSMWDENGKLTSEKEYGNS